MVTHESLLVRGHQGGDVPNSFLRQDVESDHLALILPGMGYSVHHPLLYYPAMALRQAGVDLMLAEYVYRENADFQRLDMPEKIRWLRADAAALLAAGLGQRRYARLTLIGKSLGTLGMAHLLAGEPTLPPSVQLVWLTPLIQDAVLCEQLRRYAGSSLLVIGTSDPFFDAARLDELGQIAELQIMQVAGGDHSLNLAEDVVGSIKVLESVMAAIESRVTADQASAVDR